LALETILAVAQAGRSNMPAFGRAYTEPDLRDIAAYITDVLGK
jgi:mono/diheme cytochrome c family protein